MQEKLQHLKTIFERNSETILIVLLFVFFVSEAVTKISYAAKVEIIEVQAALKLVVFGIATIGVVLFKRKEVFYVIVLTIIFCIGQLAIPNSFEFPILKYFSKFIFPIVFFGFFSILSHSPKPTLLKCFEYLLIFNSALIVVGLLFEIKYFRTYTVGARFGYNGLLVTSATSTYFYIIGLCYFLMRYKRNVIQNWIFWVIAICGMIVGTKSVALTLAGIGLFYILCYIKNRRIKFTLLFLTALAIAGFAYYLFFINVIFQSIMEKSGFVTSFLSLRDQLFLEHTLPYIQEQWGIINYFFGGVSNFELRPQMELIDALFFWGIMGSFAYFYFYFKSYIQFPFKDILVRFILILILCISFLAGNFFYNASVVIYLIVLRESFIIFCANPAISKGKDSNIPL